MKLQFKNYINMCIYVGAVVEVTIGSDNVLSGIVVALC